MGSVITDLLAVAGQSAPDAADALSRVTPQAFGVNRAAAVIVLIFAFSLGSMILAPGGPPRVTAGATKRMRRAGS
jgi:hypothetical protein